MRKARHRSKAGAILICLMTCLLISTSLVAMSLQMSLQSRRECKVAGTLRQTNLLVDAGLYRALQKLRENDRYVGETWKPKVTLSGCDDISVEISAKPEIANAIPTEVQITVVARIESPVAMSNPMQQSRSFIVNLSEIIQAEATSCP